VGLAAVSFAASDQLITNDNVAESGGNSASFYRIGPNGRLTITATVKTGGTGTSSFKFVGDVLHAQMKDCVYAGDAEGPTGVAPGDVAAIKQTTHKLAGTFRASQSDEGSVGLAETPNGRYLFAAYTSSSNIASYRQVAGCKLKFLGEVNTVGGDVNTRIAGMRVAPNGKYLITTYDYPSRSIGSWKINANGSLTFVGYEESDVASPATVDITANSKYAVFGDTVGHTVVVAEILAGGSLGPVTHYVIPGGTETDNVLISPDGKWLYIANRVSGQFSAAPFNSSTGVIDIANACTSNVLKNFGSTWHLLTGLAMRRATGTGSLLYGAEYNGVASPSGIAIVAVKVKGGTCSLVETSASPASDPSPYLSWVFVSHPRKF
jgi:6-phosphogluconolactonase (cycloisomerase 2 family)